MRISIAVLVAVCILICCQCDSANSRIINGSDAVFSPHYVKLTVYPEDYSKFSRGSGTLITRRFVLTSATFMINAYLVEMQYGSTRLADMIQVGFYPDVYLHPQFNADTFENDIAIIELPAEINHETVNPINIMRDIRQPENRLGDIVSFGWTPYGSNWVQNDRKLSFQSSWVDDRTCAALLGDRAEVLADTHFCAKDYFESTSVCHGDLGAGFVMYIDSVHYLTGVLSVVTNMCNPAVPAMYTRVAPYANWIDSITGGF